MIVDPPLIYSVPKLEWACRIVSQNGSLAHIGGRFDAVLASEERPINTNNPVLVGVRVNDDSTGYFKGKSTARINFQTGVYEVEFSANKTHQAYLARISLRPVWMLTRHEKNLSRDAGIQIEAYNFNVPEPKQQSIFGAGMCKIKQGSAEEGMQ